MTQDPGADAPPGWYPDPAGTGGRRWWDGARWSAVVTAPGPGRAPGPGGGAPTPEHPQTAGFAIAATVLGVTAMGPLAVGFGVAALRQIKRSAGALTGRGLALAGLGLGAVWSMALVALIVLGALGHLDSVNEDDFAGEAREVALTLDRIEDAYNEDDEPRLCDELFTAGFARRYTAGEPSCESGVDLALDDAGSEFDLWDFDARRIRVEGGRAVADLEGGETWTFRRVGGLWRLDDDGYGGGLGAPPAGTPS